MAFWLERECEDAGFSSLLVLAAIQSERTWRRDSRRNSAMTRRRKSCSCYSATAARRIPEMKEKRKGARPCFSSRKPRVLHAWVHGKVDRSSSRVMIQRVEHRYQSGGARDNDDAGRVLC